MTGKLIVGIYALAALSQLFCSSALASSSQYVIQVGVFTSEANVARLGHRLGAQGFPNTIQQTTLQDGRTAYQLLVGPYSGRKESVQVREQLKSFRIHGFIRLHTPRSETPHPPVPPPAISAEPSVPETQQQAMDSSDTPDDGADADSPWELAGHVALEGRYFPHGSTDSRQATTDVSMVLQPEFYYAWNGDKESVTFTPFVRIDHQDRERSHHDIRELMYQKASYDWELKAGIGKVFWGVTESQHLVDIINQTDLVENPDGEDKLGQPMVDLTLITDNGTFDLFVLPRFRERTFPGTAGRLRTTPYIDSSQPLYESSRRNHHTDFALRWSKSIDYWDIGLSHFNGTSREPRLILATDGSGNPALIPYYDIIRQTGVDIQATRDAWLWKLELIRRQGQLDTYTALTGGFEYTFYGVLDSQADIGAIVEYLYDDRNEGAATPFEDDIMLGARLALNDVQSTELLLGTIVDLDSSAYSISIEASRRIGNNMKLSIEGRSYSHMGNPMYQNLQNDDYLQVELARYF